MMTSKNLGNQYVIDTLQNCEKALAVLFTMLTKSAPQGAMACDEIRGHVQNALHWARDFDRKEREMRVDIAEWKTKATQAAAGLAGAIHYGEDIAAEAAASRREALQAQSQVLMLKEQNSRLRILLNRPL